MEEFGARTEKPLETCLAEVDQCDVYVGIIAFRVGSVDESSGKSFTQLEYERALERRKEVLIYLADEEAACFPYSQIDGDTQNRAQLEAFKTKLREQHTVDNFSTPDDLAEKLNRDFTRRFISRESRPADHNTEGEFKNSAEALSEFLLTPSRFNGAEVRLTVAFTRDLFPASRSLCQRFNLEYGNTIGIPIHITRPADRLITEDFTELFATGDRIDTVRKLGAEKEADIYARLQFSTEDVTNERARFLGHRFTSSGAFVFTNPAISQFLGGTTYVAPEGKVLLLFSKPA
jgi:hypothetical protein